MTPSRSPIGIALAVGLALGIAPAAALSTGPQSANAAQTGPGAGAASPAATGVRGLYPINAVDSHSVEFFGALLRAGTLGELLDLRGPHTVFLPLDRAFDGMDGRDLSDLVHDPSSLRALLRNHVVSGKVSAAELQANTALTTIGGNRLQLSGERPLKVNHAQILASAQTGDWIVHYIDRLL